MELYKILYFRTIQARYKNNEWKNKSIFKTSYLLNSQCFDVVCKKQHTVSADPFILRNIRRKFRNLYALYAKLVKYISYEN